jgi:hypothetical protein
MALAYQCFRLALASQNDHAEAYNNLGVLEMRKGHNDQVLQGVSGTVQCFWYCPVFLVLSSVSGTVQWYCSVFLVLGLIKSLHL